MSNERNVTSNKQKVTSNKQKITSNLQNVKSIKPRLLIILDPSLKVRNQIKTEIGQLQRRE